MWKVQLKQGQQELVLEVEAEDGWEEVQAKIFALTDIPPRNLKLMCKGRMIKDLAALQAIADSVVMVLGTKTTQELKPVEPTAAKACSSEPAAVQRSGLANIGNTCYFNAGVQLLRSVPAFGSVVALASEAAPQNVLLKMLHVTLQELQAKDVNPKMLVSALLHYSPQFRPLGEQHDADELIQELLRTIASAGPQAESALDKLFQVRFEDQLSNLDFEERPARTEHASWKICCSLGGVEKAEKVGTLQEGLKLSLGGVLEKTSAVDGQLHRFRKETRIAALPPFLLVQMVRFFWKQPEEDVYSAKPVATKICKTIDFGAKLDLFEFCSEELRARLQAGRARMDAFREREEARFAEAFAEYRREWEESNKPEVVLKQQFGREWRLRQRPVEAGLETGVFELCGVVTHLGYSADSGHYMAWVKHNDEEWTKFDDIDAFTQPADKVLQLRGGQPNLEIGYVLLYRKTFIPE